jgi:hypothetical protein
MSNPGEWTAPDGRVLRDTNFEYAIAYGRATADVAERALASAERIELTPFLVRSKPVQLRLDNPVYKLGRTTGVLRRDAFLWTGDPDRRGDPVKGPTKEPIALETEVGYLRLGDLHVAAIPGELYPELVYGQFQDPAEPNADFPEAPLERPVASILPGPKFMLFGLANDEVGYIIPKRQWDDRPPYAYGKDDGQYGEINSVGPDAAPTLMQALEAAVRDAG